MKRISKIWVYLKPLLSTSAFIRVGADNKKVITPNMTLIETGDIISICTSVSYKNFIMLKSKSNTYYLHTTMTKFIKQFKGFTQINKSQAIRISAVNSRLGFRYLFIDSNFFSVSDPFINDVKKWFEEN